MSLQRAQKMCYSQCCFPLPQKTFGSNGIELSANPLSADPRKAFREI